jgi:uncharacterized protein (TIGR03032 family)
MAADADRTLTAVDYEHSPSLTALLGQLGASLVVSTYQAGKVITVGVHQQKADIRFYHFEQAMGVARTPTGLAVGSRRQIWTLAGHPDLGPRVAPANKYDIALLTRQSHYTGPVMGHEMGWGKGQFWFINTLFSCLCVVHPDYNFVPKWKPPFVSKLAPEDRCHLNGLAMEGEEPRYVTALGETDTAGGWRPNKATGGCLIDLNSSEIVLRGLCMPHSPRVHQGRTYFLDSGRGHLCVLDGAKPAVVAGVTGYTRGMDLRGNFAFVGMSRIRETSVFGGLPIAEKRDELRCGVAVIDLRTGQLAAFLHFLAGVEEVFEVKLLPGFRCPILSGPLPDTDQTEPLWLSPPFPN